MLGRRLKSWLTQKGREGPVEALFPQIVQGAERPVVATVPQNKLKDNAEVPQLKLVQRKC